MATYKIVVNKDRLQQGTIEKMLESLKGSYSIQKVEKVESRADRLSEAHSMVDDAKSIVEELQGEMQEWYDNLPENLQGGDKASMIEEAAGNLQNLLDELENVDFDTVEFPGMY